MLLLPLEQIEVFVVIDVFIKRLRAVDLNDTSSNRIHEFLIVRSKGHTALKVIHSIIKRRDRFEVEVVGRLVEQQEVGAEQHHAGEHAAHLLSAREDVYRLEHADV